MPPEFIGRRVELKFSQKIPGDIFLYDNGIRVTKIAPVNSQLNGQTYKPSPRISDIALHTANKNPGDPLVIQAYFRIQTSAVFQGLTNNSNVSKLR